MLYFHNNCRANKIEPILRRSNAPIEGAITLDEVKSFLRISLSNIAEDSLLNNLISMATEYAEWYMRRSLMPQQWSEGRYGFLPKRVMLSYGPIESIERVDMFHGNVRSTISSDNYYLEFGEYLIFSNNIYADRFEIIYNTGYANRDNIPYSIKEGILHHVSMAYYNRSEILGGEVLNRSHALYRQFKEFSILL